MRETISIATILILLAITGSEAGQNPVGKTCHIGSFALFAPDC